MRLTLEQALQEEDRRYQSNVAEYGDMGWCGVLLLRWYMRKCESVRMVYSYGGCRVIPGVMQFEQCGVQPLVEPVGLVFSMRSRYRGIGE